MKLIAALSIFVLGLTIISCNSSTPNAPKAFCDTVCIKDTMKFMGPGKLQPSVFISPKDCNADSIEWTYKGMGTGRKTSIAYLLKDGIRMNKDFTRCVFRDTAAAYLLFNDCATGRGYQLTLPFNKTANIGRKNSGLNNFDPKFSIADNLLVFTDRGNIFVEDMNTGKKAMMTFGKDLEIDYEAIHDYIDSVNITNERIWVKVMIDKQWTPLEKKITFQ